MNLKSELEKKSFYFDSLNYRNRENAAQQKLILLSDAITILNEREKDQREVGEIMTAEQFNEIIKDFEARFNPVFAKHHNADFYEWLRKQFDEIAESREKEIEGMIDEKIKELEKEIMKYGADVEASYSEGIEVLTELKSKLNLKG